MGLLGVPSLVALLFAGLVWARLQGAQGRRSSPRRILTGAALGAGFGFLLVSVLAALLLESYARDTSEWRGLGTAILTLASYVVVVPLANWLGLRILGVRPAWLAALGAWALLGLGEVGLVYLLGGWRVPGWVYGLGAVPVYGLASAATVWVPLEERELPVAAPVA